MNWRGHQVKLRQNNQFVANPFLVFTAGYGVLWDNYSTTTFRDNAAGASFASEVGDYIDYHFVYGPALDAVVAGYRDLTGPAPLFGKWALGLWQSRERYQSQAELPGVLDFSTIKTQPVPTRRPRLVRLLDRRAPGRRPDHDAPHAD